MEKLIEIQNELISEKTEVNEYGKFKYRSAEEILKALKPLLLKKKCLLILTDEILQVGEKYFLQAKAKFKHENFEIENFAQAELSVHKGMSAEQATGAASSYARKYALGGLFLLSEKDLDGLENENEFEAKEKILLKCKSENDLQNEWEKLNSLEQKKFKQLFSKRKNEINQKN